MNGEEEMGKLVAQNEAVVGKFSAQGLSFWPSSCQLSEDQKQSNLAPPAIR